MDVTSGEKRTLVELLPLLDFPMKIKDCDTLLVGRALLVCSLLVCVFLVGSLIP